MNEIGWKSDKMEEILEFMKCKLKYEYISDLRNPNKLYEITSELLKVEKEYSKDEITYLLKYITSDF